MQSSSGLAKTSISIRIYSIWFIPCSFASLSSISQLIPWKLIDQTIRHQIESQTWTNWNVSFNSIPALRRLNRLRYRCLENSVIYTDLKFPAVTNPKKYEKSENIKAELDVDHDYVKNAVVYADLKLPTVEYQNKNAPWEKTEVKLAFNRLRDHSLENDIIHENLKSTITNRKENAKSECSEGKQD